jgi:hypothetical protein
MSETPNYIKALLMPNGRKPQGKRVWGIDLEMVWLPFLTATNTMGDTAIPADCLGAPIRLGYAPDGSVKFSKSGRPVTKVVKEVADSVRLIRENFVAGLLTYAGSVANDNPDGYRAMVATAQEAGQTIIASDKAKLEKAMAEAVAHDIEQAQAKARAKSNRRVAVTA